MGLGNIVRFGLRCVPYRTFVKMYPMLKNSKYRFLADFADDVYEKRFFKKSALVSDTENYINKITKKKKYILIKKSIWDYQIANFCFVKDILSLIIWSLDRGYIPIVSYYPKDWSRYSESDKRLWDMFYLQPIDNEPEKTSKVIDCPIDLSSIHASFMDCYDKDKVGFWNKMLNMFVKYNDESTKYLEDEYNELIKGKTTVACVMRSTDYTKLEPSGHPKQPSLEEVFEKLDETMERYKIDYIYLATEDGNIADEFKKRFPNKVLENKREYYNTKFKESNADLIGSVHFSRKNDDYLKMLEYISSINIVSKCEYLVTGLCGGSQMAIYRNGNSYKYSYIFDKGVY